MLLCKIALPFIWGRVGAERTQCVMVKLLSIFPSQIRLSDKKMDQINHESQQVQTFAGNCCLSLWSSAKKEARGKSRTRLAEAVS